MKTNVLITGIGGGGVGEQILKCLKMSSLDLNIIGCDMNRSSQGLKIVDKGYIIPAANDDNYIETILKICKNHDVKMIFHGSEPELLKLSDNREIFEENNIIIPLNPRSVIDICMDKKKTMDFLSEIGLEVQRYWEVKCMDDIKSINIFPLVLKPSVGGGGSVNTFIVQDEEELVMFSKYLLKIYKSFLAQEYVGDVNHEFTAGVMSSRDGEYVNSIAVKKSILSGLSNRCKVKNYTARKELGDILAISSGVSQGMIGRFPEVTETCRKIAQKLGATAPINVQCRVQNGKVYVFEINPRISGTSSLRALVGYNEPEMLIRERVLDEIVPVDFAYKEGWITRGLNEVFIESDFMASVESV